MAAPRHPSQDPEARIAALEAELAETRAALQRAEHEHRLHTLIEYAPYGALEYCLHADGRLVLVDANAAADRILGIPCGERLGLTLEEAFPANVGTPVPEAFRAVARTGEPFEDRQYFYDDGAITGAYEITAFQTGPMCMAVLFRDIGERARAHAALLESEERYRLATQVTGQVVYEVDLKAGRARLDGAFEQVLGYTREELSGIDGAAARAMMHEDDRPAAVAAMEQAVANGGDYRVEYRLQRRDGTYIDAEDYGTIVRAPDGTPVRAIGAIRDVTARRASEAALRESETRYRTLVETAQDGVVLLDLEGRIVFANRCAADLVGLDEGADAVGRSVYDWIAPQDQPRAVGLLALAVVQGRLSHMEMTVRRGNGTTFDADLNGTAILDGDRPRYVMVTIRDVTARRQAEEALAAETERLTVTLRSIGDGVIATDALGRIQLMNPVAEALTGWAQAEAVGHDLFEVYGVDRDGCADPSSTVGVHAPMRPRPVRLTSRTGEVHDVAERATPIRNARSEIIGTVVVIRDMTAENRLQAEVQRMAKLESLGVLAGGIAHDFNNLLTAISGNVGLAQMAAEAGDATRLARYLAESERATMRARDLTQQLLTFARGGAPVRSATDLAPVIEEAVTFALTGSRCRAAVEVDADLWPAHVDAGQIGQVLHNLLLNADQAMPHAGVITVHAANVWVGEEAGLPLTHGPYVALRVVDRGTGIPADLRERIFDPFFTTKPRGNGLGLASAFSIVKGHQGHIAVESEPGEGSTLTVYLPALPGSPVSCRDSVGAATVLSPMRILVMDDERMVADMLAELLQQAGHTVRTTADGATAVQAWLDALETGEPFDLAILDLTVPGGIGGVATLHLLQAHDSGARAVASSGYATDPILAEYAAHGFVGRLAKPYRLAEVIALLTRLQQESAPQPANQ